MSAMIKKFAKKCLFWGLKSFYAFFVKKGVLTVCNVRAAVGLVDTAAPAGRSLTGLRAKWAAGRLASGRAKSQALIDALIDALIEFRFKKGVRICKFDWELRGGACNVL